MDQQREQGFLINAVLRKVSADAVDFVPVVGILVRHKGGLDLLRLAHNIPIFRDDAADQLRLPADQRAVTERVDNLVTHGAACREDRLLLRISLKILHIFPDGCRGCAEQAVAFLLRIVLEHIFLAAIGTILFQIESILARLLGKLRQQLIRRMRDGSLDAVQHCRIDGGQHQIGIRIRIAGAQLEAGREGIVDVADQARQNRTVAGRNLRRMSQGRHDADRRLEAGLQAVQGIIGRRDKGIDDLIIL